MDEIEIWAIEESQVVPIERATMDSESVFEDTLVKHPKMIIPDLTLVGRQTPVAGGNLDLLGIDDEGRLVVLELKRDSPPRDAVAQVIDYGSALEAMAAEDLAQLISEGTGRDGIDRIGNFEEWYREEYRKSLDELRPLRMFLVGLGTDETTKRMVDYIAERGVDISLLTFYGFEYAGKTLLAKQVQVEGAASSSSLSSRSRAERWSSLENYAKELGLTDLVEVSKQMFLDVWREVIRGKYSEPYPEPRATGITYYILTRPEGSEINTYLAFLSIEIDQRPKGIKIRFCPRAIDLCKEKFGQLNANEIPFEKQVPRHAATTERVKEEILFPIHSHKEWELRREELSALTRAVYENWLTREKGENAS